MFSMGSGIAAVYSIAKSITDNELEETRIDFIGSFHSVSQIPLKKELQILSDYWNFMCTLYISQLHSELLVLINVTPKVLIIYKNLPYRFLIIIS